MISSNYSFFKKNKMLIQEALINTKIYAQM